jgi:putative DNA primase/helicase
MVDAVTFTIRDYEVQLPCNFFFDQHGLIYQPPPKGERESDEPVWIAAPFEVIAKTSDEAGQSWGLLLRWLDRAGRSHEWAMPLRLIHSDGNTIASHLEDAGLSCASGRYAHERLRRFLVECV